MYNRAISMQEVRDKVLLIPTNVIVASRDKEKQIYLRHHFIVQFNLCGVFQRAVVTIV